MTGFKPPDDGEAFLARTAHHAIVYYNEFAARKDLKERYSDASAWLMESIRYHHFGTIDRNDVLDLVTEMAEKMAEIEVVLPDLSNQSDSDKCQLTQRVSSMNALISSGLEPWDCFVKSAINRSQSVFSNPKIGDATSRLGKAFDVAKFMLQSRNLAENGIPTDCQKGFLEARMNEARTPHWIFYAIQM